MKELPWYAPAGLNKTTLPEIPERTVDMIDVRRLVNFISREMNNSLQQFVFEPNDEYTRAKIADVITSYATMLWQQGAVDEYEVVCDTTNNPPNVIKNNELVVDVFFTPSMGADIGNIRAVVARNELVLDSSVLTKEDSYSRYEYAMQMLGKQKC